MKKLFFVFISIFIFSLGIITANTDPWWTSKITMNPSTPTAGQSITFFATLKVSKGDAISGFEVVVTVDGKNSFNQMLPPMPRGASQTVSFTWTATSGAHMVSFHIDPTNKAGDINPGNNYIEFMFDVGSGMIPNPNPPVLTGEVIPNVDPALFAFKPNFVIDYVHLSHEEAVVGLPFTIIFQIRNTGEGKSAFPPQAQVLLNNLPPVNLKMRKMYTGAEMKVGDAVEYTAEYLMKHVFPPCKLVLKADPGNIIAETNEKDNISEPAVNCVKKSLDNLHVTDFQVRKCWSGTNIFQFVSMYKSDKCATVIITIDNEGKTATPPGILWDLNVWGQVISGSLPPIPPYSRKTIYVSGKCGCGAWFKFHLDSTDALEEYDESDNYGSATLYDCN
ncbi:MAG: hypothetical protein JW737_06615 [Acidobacteria bacterium]|nr:hypothetical protein [Acidobacteriota bacterium]